jgi:hypothetical protein
MVRGTVRFQDLEGGFWGIVGDDQQSYLPVDALPLSMQTDGCRVQFEFVPANVVSFMMWGQPVRITRIEEISAGRHTRDA